MTQPASDTMRAVRLTDAGVQLIGDHPRPVPAPGEVLVRVTRAAICGTDLELARGFKGGYRGVLGHEFTGVVEDGADGAWRGRRVTATLNVGCGRCDRCRADGPEHCAARAAIGIFGRDGAFADYVAVPARNLVAVPDDVPDEVAVFIEPLAAALRIREQIAIRPSARIAVIGPGRLGMLVGAVLSLAGSRVVMVGRRAESLALARAWGLETAVAGEAGEAGAAVVSDAGVAGDAGDALREAFDIAVDATGEPAGLNLALRLVRPRGTIILKSTFAGAATVDVPRIAVSEITLIGSRCGPFAPAVRLLAQGAVDVRALIDGDYPLADAAAAFAHAARPGARTILLRP